MTTPRPRILLVAATLLIGLLAPLLSSGSASAAVPSRTSLSGSIAYDVQALLNQERAAHHLPPLAMANRIRIAARQHSRMMARTNTMSHQLPGEPAIGGRLSRVGYRWSWAGENVGWNSEMDANGVLALERAMYNEKAPNDDHRLNILNTHFTTVGVDVLFDRAHGKVWLTVDFGRHA